MKGGIRVHRLSSLAGPANYAKDGKLSRSVHENLVANDKAPNFGESADAFAYDHQKNNDNMGIFVDQVDEQDGTENK